MNGPEGFLPKKQIFTMQVAQVLWDCPHFLNRPTVRPLRDQNIFLIQENENFLYQASKADFTVKTF